MPRKRDGLYRRGNIFAFRYKDTDGTWREKQTGKRDREEAKQFKNDFFADLNTGTLPTQMAEWTLEQARDWWLEFRKPRIAVPTLTAEGYRLKPMIAILGNLRLKQISNVLLDNYVTKRLAEEIAPWSINKEVLTWSMILKKAKLWKRFADDYRPLQNQGFRYWPSTHPRRTAEPCGDGQHRYRLGNSVLRFCSSCQHWSARRRD